MKFLERPGEKTGDTERSQDSGQKAFGGRYGASRKTFGPGGVQKPSSPTNPGHRDERCPRASAGSFAESREGVAQPAAGAAPRPGPRGVSPPRPGSGVMGACSRAAPPPLRRPVGHNVGLGRPAGGARRGRSCRAGAVTAAGGGEGRRSRGGRRTAPFRPAAPSVPSPFPAVAREPPVKERARARP